MRKQNVYGDCNPLNDLAKYCYIQGITVLYGKTHVVFFNNQFKISKSKQVKLEVKGGTAQIISSKFIDYNLVS